MPVVKLTLEEIAEPVPGSNSWSLVAKKLRTPTHAFVPIAVGKNAAKYLIASERQDDEWKATELFQNSAISSSFSAASTQPSHSPCAFLDIRVLNLAFTVVGTGSDLQITPLWDAPKYGLKRNIPTNLSRVMEKMQAEAKEILGQGDNPRPR